MGGEGGGVGGSGVGPGIGSGGPSDDESKAHSLYEPPQVSSFPSFLLPVHASLHSLAGRA